MEDTTFNYKVLESNSIPIEKPTDEQKNSYNKILEKDLTKKNVMKSSLSTLLEGSADKKSMDGLRKRRSSRRRSSRRRSSRRRSSRKRSTKRRS